MFNEAHAFHKFALPVFLLVCIFLYLTGCGDEKTYYITEHHTTNTYDILELTDLCGSSTEDETIDLDRNVRIVIGGDKCEIEINTGENDEA